MRKFPNGFPNQRGSAVLLLFILTLAVSLALAGYAASQQESQAFLPIVAKPEPTPTPIPPVVEFRGLWVTRFDWTLNAGDIKPALLDRGGDWSKVFGIDRG